MTDPIDSQAAQTPGPNPNPRESGGRSTDDNDVSKTQDNEVEPDDLDVAGDDASAKPS